MKAHERDFFVARIRAGYIPVKISGQRFTIHHPNDDIALCAQEKYIEAYEQAEEEGLMTDEELLDSLITQGVWSDTLEDEYQRIAPGHIEYWKIELYQSTLKSNTRKAIRKGLATAKTYYEKLTGIRHHYDYVTIDGYANYIRSSYIIEQCTLFEGNPVDWQEHNLGRMMGEYHNALLKTDDVRELARTTPWNALWSVLKAGGTIFNSGPLTVEQQSLLSWSTMYDRIYESPECPPDDVIEDDDMLDGWLLVQKRKREAEKKKQEVESHLNPKMQNADEIFIPVETMADAQKVDMLNPTQIQGIKKRRMKHLKEKGVVKEQEFKDVQQKRSMLMQQAYNQHVKGR